MSSFDPLQQPLRGSHSIEASAGTGKTYSITVLWLRLVLEEGLRAEEILVSTFTRAATAELRRRLLSSLRKAHAAAVAASPGAALQTGPEWSVLQQALSRGIPQAELNRRLAEALSAFDLAPIATLHGFCQSLISRHSLELGCDPALTLVENCDFLVQEIADDEIMALAEHEGIDPTHSRAVARCVSAHPGAELLGVSADIAQVVADLLEQIREKGPNAHAQMGGNANSRAAVEKALRLLLEKGEWKPLTDTQIKALDPAFVLIWNQYGVAQAQSQRLLRSRVAQKVARDLPQRKAAAGIRSFDDILSTLHEGLRQPATAERIGRSVRQRLKAAILDECQDSDAVQIAVLSQLFHHPDAVCFLVIGDPKQSIYRFRGADLASYKQLAAKTRPAAPMTRNHRSDAPLIGAINALYGADFVFEDTVSGGETTRYIPVTAQAEESRIQDPQEASPLVVLWSERVEREAAVAHLSEMVALECKRLLSSGVLIADRHTGRPRSLVAGDIAVLASQHSQLQTVRHQLTLQGIPCQSSGNGLGSVFGSEETQDLLAWLELLGALQGHGNVLGKLLAFLGTPLGGASGQTLLRLQADTAEQARWSAHFDAQFHELQRSGPLPALLRMLALPEVRDANFTQPGAERRYTNWRHLGSLLQHEYARGRSCPDSLAAWLRRRAADRDGSEGAPAADSEESSLMKLETDAPTVQLVTIHGSKGLEYPIVFCPFLWTLKKRVVWPKKAVAALWRRSNDWALDVGSPDFEVHLGLASDQEAEEDHRKLYVALTRARHRVYLGLCPAADEKSDAAGPKASPLLQLPGLGIGEKPPAEWPDALQALPGVSFRRPPAHSRIAPDEPLPRSGPILEVALCPPEPPLPYPFAFVRTASFSSLSKSDHESAAPADRDEDSAGVAPPFLESPGEDPLQALGSGGAVLGDRLHHVLEEFLGNRKSVEESVFGSEDPSLWSAALEAILDSPLRLPGHSPTTLRLLQPQCITEMHFQLPLHALCPRRLGKALLLDPAIHSEPPRKAWAERVTLWSFGEFEGFLQGFIDLIFEHEGRWFVADYKSNRLEHYGAGALEHAMLEKHYLLQARLYALALHRHLRLHLADYDHATHFGGVAYLFVRGLPSQGLWFERPSLDAIESLGNLFAVPNA
ncbi:MAG: hypothetical protein RLZZ399_624 [Verrucomicrobiota bacterium]|jgi:exodeoxyribonuclease V beta subunit